MLQSLDCHKCPFVRSIVTFLDRSHAHCVEHAFFLVEKQYGSRLRSSQDLIDSSIH
jgi:hypothetical protein